MKSVIEYINGMLNDEKTLKKFEKFKGDDFV